MLPLLPALRHLFQLVDLHQLRPQHESRSLRQLSRPLRSHPVLRLSGSSLSQLLLTLLRMFRSPIDRLSILQPTSSAVPGQLSDRLSLRFLRHQHLLLSTLFHQLRRLRVLCQQLYGLPGRSFLTKYNYRNDLRCQLSCWEVPQCYSAAVHELPCELY